MLLVCRFDVPAQDAAAFTGRAGVALRLLSAQPTCREARLGRSPDRLDRWVLVARFDSVVGYRRALSPFEVREHVVPLLSEARVDDPAAYETLLEAADGTLTENVSVLSNPGTPVRRDG